MWLCSEKSIQFLFKISSRSSILTSSELRLSCFVSLDVGGLFSSSSCYCTNHYISYNIHIFYIIVSLCLIVSLYVFLKQLFVFHPWYFIQYFSYHILKIILFVAVSLSQLMWVVFFLQVVAIVSMCGTMNHPWWHILGIYNWHWQHRQICQHTKFEF